MLNEEMKVITRVILHAITTSPHKNTIQLFFFTQINEIKIKYRMSIIYSNILAIGINDLEKQILQLS